MTDRGAIIIVLAPPTPGGTRDQEGSTASSRRGGRVGPAHHPRVGHVGVQHHHQWRWLAAPGQAAVHGQLCTLEARLRAVDAGTHEGSSSGENFRGRTWVTRKGIHVDRMASAWLIRRLIDPDAVFKFVEAKGYRREPAELRFDMFEAEYTHEGDQCTFEVLVKRFELTDPALRPIAEIVHDIDLKDAKFERAEASGIDRLIAGIAMANKDDDVRLTQGSSVFDGLFEYYRRKKS